MAEDSPRRRQILAALIAALPAACGVNPGDRTQATETGVGASFKDTAACVHAALERRVGSELRTETFDFKGEVRFTHVIGLSLVAGIGNVGTFTPWSVSVLDSKPGSSIVLNAGEPYRSRLADWLASCGLKPF